MRHRVMIESNFRLNTFGFGNQNVRMSKFVVGLAEMHTEIDRMKSIWNPRSHLAGTLSLDSEISIFPRSDDPLEPAVSPGRLSTHPVSI